MVFKCKMCGGDVTPIKDTNTGKCEFCKSIMTFPTYDDDKIISLYNRADYFRRNNEFDKAAGIFEQILNEKNTDADAYWSIVLCRYGIEYVEDPRTKKMIPTVNRTQYSSIFADKDYVSALKYANDTQKKIYEDEANQIDKIQKGILSVSKTEEPFDVFICYKETDENGDRTIDSVHAQDIYKELINEGYKVFFSRITLEDKLGSSYEPYIFAALNSAKVMIVLGTKPEYFEAVWVKNEWKRYLDLIKAGKKKTIIPAYKDMSPYELPDEFSYIQAQDIGKIGFMQDLVHGINKIIPLKNKSDEYTSDSEMQMVKSMTNKAFDFLEKGDVKSAKVCLDTLYAYDSNNALYFVALLMIKYNCKEFDELYKLKVDVSTFSEFEEAFKYADDELKEKLELVKYSTIFNKLNFIYENNAKKELEQSIILFEQINYDRLILLDADLAEKIKLTKNKFSEKIEKIKKEEEENLIKKEELKKKMKKRMIIILISLLILIVIILAMIFIIIPSIRHKKSEDYVKNKEFDKAILELSQIKDFKDVADKIFELECNEIKHEIIGAEIYYGSYMNHKNGKKEPIKWRILDREEGKILVISTNILDAVKYNKEYKDVTWDDSSLKMWLNNEFLTNAFSESEKNNIDHSIFILNKNEINKYFNGIDKSASATQYAIKSGAQVASNGKTPWWVREDSKKAKTNVILSTGNFDENETKFSNDFVGVRPAMWIKVNSINSVDNLGEEECKNIYDDAKMLYDNNKIEEAIEKFVIIIDYEESRKYFYEGKYKLAQSLLNDGKNEEYIRELKEMADKGYEPAKIEYDGIISEQKRKEQEYNDAMNFIEGTWYWKNSYGCTMIFKDKELKIMDGNPPSSLNFVYNYDVETQRYCLNWNGKYIKIDNSKLRLYEENGKVTSLLAYENFATKEK